MKTLVEYEQQCDVILAAPRLADVRGLLQRIQARKLYPHLLGRVCNALESLAAGGQLFWITQGERTWDEQHQLYLKGRRGIAGEGIVTKVDAGASAHNYGVAVDAAFDKDGDLKTGLQPSWDMPWMKVWADAAKLQGLEAGYYWHGFVDGPHVQLPLGSRDLTIKALRDTYQSGGKVAVFNLLDTKNWS